LAASGFASAGFAASTSAFTMRPCGPEPVTCVRSSPFSFAMRRARGEAKTRSPSEVFGAGGAGVAASAMEASVAGSARSGALPPDPAASFSSAPPPPAGASALSRSAASSPSSSSTAMGVFTFTPSAPSSIRILPIVPSSTASNSIVALSVSISAITSPEETASPSLTHHLASVPSSMVGESAGIRICVGMSGPPPQR
jgi:hypothetical protein